MTTLLIPPPAVPVEVTAEQVVAWLLRPGSGWTLARSTGDDRAFYRERSDAYAFLLDGDVQRESIEQIARAEHRHPLAVAEEIAGPSRGEVGARCAPSDRTLGRALCRFREAGARAQARGRRLSAEEAFEIATDDEDDRAARVAGESEE